MQDGPAAAPAGPGLDPPPRLVLPPEVDEDLSLDTVLPVAPRPAPENPVLSATQGFQRITAQFALPQPSWAGGKVPPAEPQPAPPAEGEGLPAVRSVYQSSHRPRDARAQAIAAQRAQLKARRDNRQRVERILLEWVSVLFVALVIVLLLTQVIFINAEVPTESMEDTVNIGDRIIGLRTAYWFSSPRRGDIIIFKFPDDEKQTYIKRVIGLPGETVEIRAGQVYINNATQPLQSAYVKGELYGDFGPYVVPEDSYFVLGDNRNRSWDARYWENTYVKKNKIVGKALFRIWPGRTVLK